MKIRFGIQLGQWPSRDIQPEAVLDLIDYFETLDLDSIWVSDRLVSSGLTLEPMTFLSYIAGRLRKMKFGTSEGMVLAASGEGPGIYLLAPDNGASPGMRVK